MYSCTTAGAAGAAGAGRSVRASPTEVCGGGGRCRGGGGIL